ncbi:MAG TPA: hypothetical protein H9716_06060 [Candidatus Enterocloster faecavium]|uniref:Uncharacterized protein n=1 Tax=Candidatus Enterocloster faecavium TaxID=2838560 RepID=A0A9D2RM13_9FIRM|nr:hypothetical protein [Candidatus Enterocloster faecavium]
MVNLSHYFLKHSFPRPDAILADFSDIQSLQIDDFHIVSFFSAELIQVLFKPKLPVQELEKTFCKMLNTPFTCFLPGIEGKQLNELIHCIINDTLIAIWDACFYQLLKGDSYTGATAARNFSIYTADSLESDYKFIQHIQNDFKKNHYSNPFWQSYWNSEIKNLNNSDESSHSSYSVSYYAGILIGLIHYLKYYQESKLPGDINFNYADLQGIITNLVSLVQKTKPLYWKKLVAKNYNISQWLPLYHLNKTWKLQHTAQLFQIITNSQSKIGLIKASTPSSSTAISRQDNGEIKIPSIKYNSIWVPLVKGERLTFTVENEMSVDEHSITLCDEKISFNSFELLFYLLSHLEEGNQNLQTICCLIQYTKSHCIPLDFDSIGRLLLFADYIIPYTQELIYIYLLNRTNEVIKNSSIPSNEEICFTILKEIGEDIRKALTEYYSDTTLKKINLKVPKLLTPFEQKIFHRLITSIYFNKDVSNILPDPQNIPISPDKLNEFIENLKGQIKQ